MTGTNWTRLALVAGLAIWTVQFARTPISSDAMGSFLHLPDLVFHEAGHIIFSPFGTAICAWWAGQNLVDLAPYIADARALRMVLLGGRTGAEVEGHDWEFILEQLGIMRYDHALGYAAHAIGIVIMVAALAYATRTILRNSE